MIFAAIKTALFLLVVLPLLTLVAYIVVAHMKPILETSRDLGERVWWAWWAVTGICLVVGYPGDVVWNALFGSYIFNERPHELTFTARVKRHYHATDNTWSQRESALTWFVRLNRIWPGHIKDRRK